MQLLLVAIGLLLVGGLGALVTGGVSRWAPRLGTGSALVGCTLGLVSALRNLVGPGPASLHLPWPVPDGSFDIGMDGLSSIFLLPVFGLSALAALYGKAYMARVGRRSLARHWFFFNVLVASMALVVVARNGLLFLVCWEAMALASFFLVTFDDDKESVRAAGWTYLVAGHLGVTLLLVFFLVLGTQAGSLDFERFAALPSAAPWTASTANLLFLLAVVGFGTKAGFVPMHVWLPEAHPAAPSHVSAVMSGVMIKMGIYGILRTLSFLGAPPAWWGGLLIGIGLVSGVLGVLFAIAQHDLKRLLAYHSVENIGIIALGIGVGVLGQHLGSPALIALGFTGAILHVINHAMFKGLLFLAAGSVLHATGTAEIDRLGGLLKRMPWTGATFLVGALAICGLPPLNGFASEFLIYLAAFHGGVALGAGSILAMGSVVAGLALMGGLCAACFAKAFGIVFLGEPRHALEREADDPGPAMRWPLVLLAAGCLAVGLLAPLIVPALAPVVAGVAGQAPEAIRVGLDASARSLRLVTFCAGLLLVLVGIVAGLRRRLLRGRTVGTSPTWDCGYARPTARMQYTASSFAQPITSGAQALLRTRLQLARPRGPFPGTASFSTATPDSAREYLYRPLFQFVGSSLARLRWLQHGNIHLYILYIAVTLLVLLMWKL